MVKRPADFRSPVKRMTRLVYLRSKADRPNSPSVSFHGAQRDLSLSCAEFL